MRRRSLSVALKIYQWQDHWFIIQTLFNQYTMECCCNSTRELVYTSVLIWKKKNVTVLKKHKRENKMQSENKQVAVVRSKLFIASEFFSSKFFSKRSVSCSSQGGWWSTNRDFGNRYDHRRPKQSFFICFSCQVRFNRKLRKSFTGKKLFKQVCQM